MIAVDTSALMAILLDEPEADACISVLEAEDDLLISAGRAEALIVAARWNVAEDIVAARWNVAEDMKRLIDGLGFHVVGVTPASAGRIAHAYEQWGKGVHPAALNFGDCFAYEVAKEHRCRLLHVGDDFSRTDVEGVIGDQPHRNGLEIEIGPRQGRKNIFCPYLY